MKDVKMDLVAVKTGYKEEAQNENTSTETLVSESSTRTTRSIENQTGSNLNHFTSTHPLLQSVKTTQRDNWFIYIATEDRYAAMQYFTMDHFKHRRLILDFHPTTSREPNEEKNCNHDTKPHSVLERLKAPLEKSIPGDTFTVVVDEDTFDLAQATQAFDIFNTKCKERNCTFIAATTTPCFELWLWLHFFDFPQETQDEITNKTSHKDNLMKGNRRRRSQHLTEVFENKITEAMFKDGRPYREKKIDPKYYKKENMNDAMRRTEAMDSKEQTGYWVIPYGSRVYLLINKINEILDDINRFPC